MTRKMLTGLAALVLLFATSCNKENTATQASNKDNQSAAMLAQQNSKTSPAIDTVKIGAQVWMTKDLAVTSYRNGDKIPQVKDPTKWGGLATGAWCYYNNDPANGILYNWYAANDSRGLAPAGWHVATDAEWTTLTNLLGGISIAGGALKETGTAHWQAPNEAATNSSGFTALPGGTRYYLGSFFDKGGYGYWWTATGASTSAAYYRYLTYFYGTVSGTTDYKTNGFSIRCIKN